MRIFLNYEYGYWHIVLLKIHYLYWSFNWVVAQIYYPPQLKVKVHNFFLLLLLKNNKQQSLLLLDCIGNRPSKVALKPFSRATSSSSDPRGFQGFPRTDVGGYQLGRSGIPPRHPNQIKCLKLLAGSFLMQRSSSYTLRKSYVLILFLRVNPNIKEGNGTVCQGHSKNDEIPVGCIQTRWATLSEFRAIVNPGFIFCSVTTQKLMARWGMEIRFTSKFRNSRSVSSLPWQADDESTCWSHAPSSWTRPWESRTLKVT